MILDHWIHLLGAMLAVDMAKGLVVVAVAFAVMRLVKRMSAEARHIIWFWVICLFFVLPLAWLVFPTIQVGALIPEESAAAYRVAVSPVLSRREYVELVEKTNRIEAVSAPGRGLRVSRFWFLLVYAWIGGVLLLVGRLAAGRWRLKRLIASADSNRQIQTAMNEAARGMSIRTEIRVLLSRNCSIPFTFGCLRPAVLLPAGSPSWPFRQLRSALVHELGHIKRRDVLTQSIAYLICMLFWFIAPIWLAYAAMVQEAETCCDRYVINQGIRRTQYARYIINLARISEGRLLLPCISSTIGRKSMLKERVKKILSLKPGQFSSGVRGTVKVLAVCLACLLPLIAVTCATKPAAISADDPLYGTWVNPEYGGARTGDFEKWVIFADGRELRYSNEADAEPCCVVGFTVIDEIWTDPEGNRWYKGQCGRSLFPYEKEQEHVYWMRKINASGTVLEFVGSEVGYPLEMSRVGGEYYIYFKSQ